MSEYKNIFIKRSDAVFACCKVLDKMGVCKMGSLCPDSGCREVRDFFEELHTIEVPEEHGRLIDADAFKKYISVWFDGLVSVLSGKYSWLSKQLTEDFIKDIDNAPTVIPAEPAEDYKSYGREFYSDELLRRTSDAMQ